MTPSKAHDESARLEDQRSADVLDTETRQALDDLARCVTDLVPRDRSAAQHGALRALARMDATCSKLRQLARDLQRANADLAAEHVRLTDSLTIAAGELRTPLAAVRGALAVLQEELTGSARDVLDVATSNTDRLLRQIQDVIDLARIEAGEYTMNRSGLLPNEIAETARSKVQSLAAQSAITIQVTAGPAPSVRGDRDPIVQVAVNLLSAAVRLSPAGRSVQVKIGVERADFVRFSFTCEGDGIAPDDLARFFDPPQRAGLGTRGSGSGGGFAMAVSKAIADASGGTIGVSSRRGQGATLWFELPVDKGLDLSSKRQSHP